MFKILADECIHAELFLAIRKRGFDIISVKEAGLTGAGDEEVFDFAVETKRILLTFDRGFGDIFRFNIARSAGVIIVMIDQMTREEIIKITLAFIMFVNESIIDGNLALVGRNKIRVIKR